MDGDSIIMIIIMVALTACSAFFSATETAYLSFNQTKMKNLAQNGNKRAQLVLRLFEDYDRLISTVLIGNNIVNITLSSLSTVLFIKFFANMGATISTVVVTVVVLIFGEITPKTVSKDFADSFVMKTVYAVRFIIYVLLPLSFIFGLWQKLIDKITVPPEEDVVTEEELITMVDEAEEGGEIDSDEGDLIRSAIGFNDLTASDILTPRSDVIFITRDMTDDEIASVFMDSGFSRLPMCDGSLDDVMGILHEKDFLYHTKNPSRSIESFLKKPVFVSKHINVYELLKILQDAKCHMAIVSDEFGAFSGVVTLEDIVEELIGEIYDEHDKVEEPIRNIGNDTYIVDCSAEVDELFSALEIEREESEDSDNAQTINGWLVIGFGYIPTVGEKIELDGLSAEIVSADQTKILEAKIKKNEVVLEN